MLDLVIVNPPRHWIELPRHERIELRRGRLLHLTA